MAFAAPPLRHPQSLFAPKPLNLLVIDDPAFRAGIVIGGPESTAGMILGVVAKPGPQRRIRIIDGGPHRLVSLGRAVLPGHAAGEPFANPQYTLEVTNGGPPAFRA